jgi:hypothetical protein
MEGKKFEVQNEPKDAIFPLKSIKNAKLKITVGALRLL